MVCHLLVLYTYVEKPIDHILQQSQYKVQYSDTSEIHNMEAEMFDQSDLAQDCPIGPHRTVLP